MGINKSTSRLFQKSEQVKLRSAYKKVSIKITEIY